MGATTIGCSLRLKSLLMILESNSEESTVAGRDIGTSGDQHYEDLPDYHIIPYMEQDDGLLIWK